MIESISWSEAKKAGLKHYFTGPCKKGHMSSRYVSTATCVECGREHAVKHWPQFIKSHPELILWRSAKNRARRASLPFTITLVDIVIPNFCPVLGIKMTPGIGKVHAASPTLDRIIPELGYVPGNVAVISWRANVIKQNATAEEIMRVSKWVSRSSA